MRDCEVDCRAMPCTKYLQGKAPMLQPHRRLPCFWRFVFLNPKAKYSGLPRKSRSVARGGFTHRDLPISVLTLRRWWW